MEPAPISTPPQHKLPVTLLVVTGVGVLLIVVIIIVAVLFTAANQSQNRSAEYVERPGYDKNALSSGILDPAPLKEIPSAEPIALAGAPVIQACNLFTLQDMTDLGLYLKPNSLLGFTRTYFNGQGTGAVEKADGDSLDPYNSCDYSLQDGSSIRLTMQQPAYNTLRLSSVFEPKAPIQEFKTYGTAERDEENRQQTSIMIGKDNNFADITLSLDKPSGTAEKKQQIIDTVVKHLREQLARPTGPPQYTFDSPAFPAAYTNACSISKPEDFATMFGEQPAPFVIEDLSTAVGAINYSQAGGDDDNLYAYLRSACKHGSGSAFTSDRKQLSLEVQSYTYDQPATYEMEYGRQTDGGQPTTQIIGDDSYIATKDEGLATKKPGSIVFRKGRIIVELYFSDPRNRPQTRSTILGENSAELEAVARVIAGRIQ